MPEEFQVVLQHLDAAYNLARWLTHDPQAAEDVVQDALVRALKAFGGFHGGDARAWILAIVRNTAFTWLAKNRSHKTLEFDETIEVPESEDTDPAALAAHSADAEMVRSAIERLPPEFREVVVLRELESLSYQEIAAVAGVPVGTVMSRLSRARARLKEILS